MRTYDFAPLWRSSVGFDRLFDLINDTQRLDAQDSYPPYDIVVGCVREGHADNDPAIREYMSGNPMQKRHHLQEVGAVLARTAAVPTRARPNDSQLFAELARA